MSDSGLTLLQGSQEFFPALVDAIDKAEHSVYLETYIFDFHRGGATVAQALLEAAVRGVCVYVLVDGAGTPEISLQWQQAWQRAGVSFRTFSPLDLGALWQRRRWRRLHRKLCVVDQSVAFCGGINILDDFWEHSTQSTLQHPRLDYAVRMTGTLVEVVQRVMQRQWQQVVLRQDWRQQSIRQSWNAIQQRARGRQTAKLTVKKAVDETKIILRDNFRYRWSIETAYRRALNAAEHEVVLASAYFYPAGRFLHDLSAAAQRGVKVKLLLQGSYEYWIAYRASRHLYGQLLQAGIEIYEYEASFLHAKVAVIDQRWVTIGSSNLDPLSLLLAREANVVTQDAYLAAQLHRSLCQAISAGAQKVDPHSFAQRGIWQRGLDAVAAAILRLGIFLSGNRY